MAEIQLLDEAQLPAVREQRELSVEDVLSQVNKIHSLMAKAMVSGQHYGVIPGTEKPTLLQPGAQKLALMFRVRPHFTTTMRNLENGHREYDTDCEVVHIFNGQVCGEGGGICSSMETRYRYRNSARKCPHCGKEAIIKGKEQYGGGWLCFKKKGGCGAKFGDTDKTITSQEVGRIENPDVADVYNTIKKVSHKRAFVAAVLSMTAASDVFTQDMEDTVVEAEIIDDPPPPAPNLMRPQSSENGPLSTPTQDPRKQSLEEIRSILASIHDVNGEHLFGSDEAKALWEARKKWPTEQLQTIVDTLREIRDDRAAGKAKKPGEEGYIAIAPDQLVVEAF